MNLKNKHKLTRQQTTEKLILEISKKDTLPLDQYTGDNSGNLRENIIESIK